MRKVASTFTVAVLLGVLPAVAAAETRTDLVLSSSQTLPATFDQPAGTVACPTVPYVVTNGPVTLGGATLTLSTTVPPGAGSGCLLIDNRGGSPVSGTFAGLPQGAVFGPPDARFRISYTAGDGNDVQLQRVEVPTVIDVSTGNFGLTPSRPVDLAVWVGGGTPTALAATGTVSVVLDGAPIPSQSLAFGSTTFSVGSLAAGPHEVRLAYSGDGFYLPSTRTTTVTVQPTLVPTVPGAPVTPAPTPAPAPAPDPTPVASAPVTADPAPAAAPTTAAIQAGLRTVSATKVGAWDVRFTQRLVVAGTVRWQVLAGGRVLASSTRAVKAGLIHARVPLPKAARRQLARQPRAKLRLQTTLTTATGPRVSSSAALR
jgi:hypothetical protein